MTAKTAHNRKNSVTITIAPTSIVVGFPDGKMVAGINRFAIQPMHQDIPNIQPNIAI
jgi:hypothetical protein